MVTFIIMAGSAWLGLAGAMTLALARAARRSSSEVPCCSELEEELRCIRVSRDWLDDTADQETLLEIESDADAIWRTGSAS